MAMNTSLAIWRRSIALRSIDVRQLFEQRLWWMPRRGRANVCFLRLLWFDAVRGLLYEERCEMCGGLGSNRLMLVEEEPHLRVIIGVELETTR